MKINRITSLGVLAAMTATAIAPVAALASDNHQSQKNLGRNIGIGGGAVALHGLLSHNSTEAILGVAGAAAGAKMYEDNRKAQSRNNARYHRVYRHYYYRHGHRYYRSY